LRTRDFDYELPPERIAQHPLPERDASRMLVVDRKAQRWAHRRFRDLPALLHAGDLLVLNDTRVLPARVYGTRMDTGGRVELLLLEKEEGGSRVEGREAELWEALMRSGFVPRPGMRLDLAEGRLHAEIVKAEDDGRVRVALVGDEPIPAILDAQGTAPLPPYIKRPSPPATLHLRPSAVDAANPECSRVDRERYQTIYASQPGAVAAPTAGLHFTRATLAALAARGVGEARVTLHVGPGTFQPVRAERIAEHRMDAERFSVPETTRRAVCDAHAAGGRVVAVGSTSVRALESAFRPEPRNAAPAEAARLGNVTPDEAARPRSPCAAGPEDRTELFIYPPYTFRAVDVMLTNFHLPRSTLLMMVSAFAAPGETNAGRDLILAAYADAVRERYRFYSYGDCMLLL
jgi:S-adenosylmethionine:tRNA ribosyltransferase-isomerase